MSSSIVLIGSSSLFAKDNDFLPICARQYFDEIVERRHLPDEIRSKVSLCGKVLISVGKLYAKNILEKNCWESRNSLDVNLLYPVILSELLLHNFSEVKIVIVSSESGFKGSYDTEYALAKSAINFYVREKSAGPGQSLNAVAPSLVFDSPMTQSRSDLSKLDSSTHPKKRFLSADELIEFTKAIFSTSDYLTNQVISIDGSKFARWK